MELKRCAFCGKTVAPEIPHYEVSGLSVCLRCGGVQTLAALAGLNAGFKPVYETPLEAEYSLAGQTVPHIEVVNVDGELVEVNGNGESQADVSNSV